MTSSTISQELTALATPDELPAGMPVIGEPSNMELPPPEVRKQLPAVDVIINGQTVETLIDWGSTVNIINPLKVNTSGAIPLGKCMVKFDGVFECTSTPNIELERVLLRIQATDLMKPVLIECWLCSKVNFTSLIAHYTYDELYSSQSNKDDGVRLLTVRSTDEVVPYRLISANLD